MAIGLGSNLGDRAKMLRFGLDRLRGFVNGLEVSSVYETAPRHVLDQPDFLNACCTGYTGLGPRGLLNRMQAVERAAGRKREARRFGPRALDLDLLLYDELAIEEPDLVVPHARLRERGFVLFPLAELAPEWKVPDRDGETFTTVAALAARIEMEGNMRTEIELV